MKTSKASTLIVALIIVSSCATDRKLVLDQPVGPSCPAEDSGKTEGWLLVHSAREVVDLVNSSHPTHSGYTLYTSDGRSLRRVRNLSGSFNEVPEAVALQAGTYKVEARAINCGWVVLPVVVENGRTTIVYLDGEASP